MEFQFNLHPILKSTTNQNPNTMETATNTSIESLNDIVFENRNKSYGAYAIRQTYTDNLSKALFSALTGSTLLIFIVFWLTKTPIKAPDIKGQTVPPETISIVMDVTPIKEDIEIEKVIPPKEHITPKADNLNLEASDDKKDFIETANENATLIKNGSPDGKDSVPSAPIENITVNTSPISTSETILIADVMPEFNGNLFQFIKNNIRYPDMARENLTSGTVVLQFVVEKDGSIGSIKPLKEVPDGCTEEAIRVVKAMPKWKAGQNHGEPVRVLFNLPVRFTIK